MTYSRIFVYRKYQKSRVGAGNAFAGRICIGIFVIMDAGRVIKKIEVIVLCVKNTCAENSWNWSRSYGEKKNQKWRRKIFLVVDGF